MNNFIRDPRNWQAILFLILAVGGTVLMLLFKPFPTWAILLAATFALIAILIIRFAYQVAKFENRVYSYFNRKKRISEEDDEPSTWKIACTKAFGYALMIPLLVFLLLH